MQETASSLELSDEELIDAAAEVTLETGHITVAMLQRRIKYLSVNS